MSRTILNPETSEKISEIRPMVGALNCLLEAFDISTDHMMEKDVDEHDESVRDLATEIETNLRLALTEICKEYHMELRFNRTDGRFVLLDIQS